jgi:signal transduction histidine kinase
MLPSILRHRSRRLLVLVTVTTAAPLAALLWLGSYLLAQDRMLEARQIQDQVEHVADLVANALKRGIDASVERLTADAPTWPAGAVTFTFTSTSAAVVPRERVAFVPVTPEQPHPPDARFAQADDLHFRKHDLQGAVDALRPLTQSANRATRTGALVRLARLQIALGQPTAALNTYEQLAAMDDVAIGDAPAALAARYARCQMFERQGRRADLMSEAARLRIELDRGRWPLTPSVYWLYQDDVTRWTVSDPRPATGGEVLGAAVVRLWERWRSVPLAAVADDGREPLSVGDRTVTVVWRKTGNAVRALVALPEFVEIQWLAPARAIARGQHAELALVTGSVPPSSLGTTVRNIAQTGLPWRIVITSTDPATLKADFAVRRRMLIAGFILLVAMAASAGIVTIAAVRREFAVARLQSDFVAAVSHEFRTPLTTLRQFTDRLRDHAALDGTSRALCYDAQARATDRLTRLVESLLEFGRMEAGARSYVLEPLDCAALVQHVTSEFRTHVGTAGDALRVCRNGPASIEADRDALSLAVWNLLDNAVKYSPPGSAVEIDVARDRESVVVAVRDHGIGIPAHEQTQIFNRFQRGRDAGTQGIRGTGLGLAIVDHIVLAHHGRITVDSTPGQGSTFRIVLPALLLEAEHIHGENSDRRGRA